ncbi:putative amino acid/polyamine transporter I [Rosa chinensis]|uniref:Putative amino acid/polyamine transporter I n=1 Tax=Rosa chinensis TaxID=74649 RepID=A0A2P6Q611_ROSCH|nr:putative amino acid/polyamine transporter I [Rosa chinensis]
MGARSQNEMKKTLNWWDLIWFGIEAVMEAGIFVLTGEAARKLVGPAVVISYLISGVSVLLSVLCYTKFVVELPVAGGSFAYPKVELGDFMAYIAAGNILFEYIVAGASASRHSLCCFFAYVGFDGVATLAEGVIGSIVITIVTYSALAATLCMMQPYSQINADASFTVAFQAAGMNWAKYIVALGALKGMSTVLLANLIGQARYFTHIGRTHMAPPILARINAKTGTPVTATIIMIVANSIVAFFTSLDVLANLLSISTLFIFSLVALALIVRRYYVTGETSATDINKLIGFLTLIIGASIATAGY